MSFRLSSASLHLDRQCWDLTRLIAEGVAGKLKSFSVNIQCFQLSLAISPIIKKKKRNKNQQKQCVDTKNISGENLPRSSSSIIAIIIIGVLPRSSSSIIAIIIIGVDRDLDI